MGWTLRRLVNSILFGITIPQEYVCLSPEGFSHPLSAYITGTDSNTGIPVSQDLFLGYKPMVIGLSFGRFSDEARWLQLQERICISVVAGEFQGDVMWKGFMSCRESIARLILRKVDNREFGESVIFIFQGEWGQHRFLSGMHQATNRMRELVRLRKPDNYLPGNLYDQVRIGYAVPRQISIITVSDSAGRMNMFPTDLHGPVDERFYAGSMRHGGKANHQIEEFGTIALSGVRADWFRQAYALGKNHMKDLRSFEEFPLSTIRSQKLGIPLPESVVHYRELRRLDSLDAGIHRIHFYETLHEEHVLRDERSLAHIHCYYAQWRKNRKLPSEYLIR